jgi:hypothetical protein
VIAKGRRLHRWGRGSVGRDFFTYTTNCASIQKIKFPDVGPCGDRSMTSTVPRGEER